MFRNYTLCRKYAVSDYFIFDVYVKKGRSMTAKHEPTAYDDVFRTETIECPKLLLPIINEVFGENYDGSEVITQSENEIF